jgi:hypothetical protein
MPCSEKIRLKDRVGGETQNVRIKLDPGSKTPGIALVADREGNKPAKGLAQFELQHRGNQISEKQTARRAFRRRRRTYIGRVAVRASGSFNVQTLTGVVQGSNVRRCTGAHRSDGYSYRGPRLLATDKSGAIRRGKIR